MLALSLKGKSGNGPGVAYAYEKSTMCGGVNRSEPNHDDLCTLALTYCPNPADPYGSGPATYVFRRTLP